MPTIHAYESYIDYFEDYSTRCCYSVKTTILAQTRSCLDDVRLALVALNGKFPMLICC